MSISGKVQLGVDPWTGLSGWCIELSGADAASVLTDATGNYTFTGLPSGSYLVCQVMQSGWAQTWPTSGPVCPSGNYGWTITLSGFNGSFVNFKNVPQ